MLIAAITAGLVAAVSAAPQTRYVGETFSYSLRAVMSQSIAGDDAFGRRFDQASAPSSVTLHERIAITGANPHGVSMHRIGSITARVDGAKPVTKSGQGWTTVDSHGIVVRDAGKLGGLFLLPLPFLASSAMKSGDELAVGDTWKAKLGSKLYGMTAAPTLTFTVTGKRASAGATIYVLDAKGSAPMKEPVMTASGEPLGFAAGVATIIAHIEYDRDNHRLVSMQADLSDSLRYRGPTRSATGRVKDHQRCEVSLDSATLAGNAADQVNADPSTGPLP